MANQQRRLASKIRPALVLLALISTSIPADARLSTADFTCSDVKDLVFQQGAIVLNTKNNSVFKRFVADQSFCLRDQRVQRINVPSKSEKCRLRYCVERQNNGN
ncbi:MAG: hypothetical protein ABJH63_03100 [Rhizobiaceae bacterium]